MRSGFTGSSNIYFPFGSFCRGPNYPNVCVPGSADHPEYETREDTDKTIWNSLRTVVAMLLELQGSG